MFERGGRFFFRFSFFSLFYLTSVFRINSCTSANFILVEIGSTWKLNLNRFRMETKGRFLITRQSFVSKEAIKLSLAFVMKANNNRIQSSFSIMNLWFHLCFFFHRNLCASNKMVYSEIAFLCSGNYFCVFIRLNTTMSKRIAHKKRIN